MRLIDSDNLRGRVCELFLCAEPSSSEERRFAIVLGLIDSEHTITPPPNAPLTLEELREMDGDPVWCVSNVGGIAQINCWTIVSVDLERCAGNTVWLNFEDYGSWLAYRQKLEEG